MRDIKFEEDFHPRGRGRGFWAWRGKTPIQVRATMESIQPAGQTCSKSDLDDSFKEKRQILESVARKKILDGDINSFEECGRTDQFVVIDWMDLP